jgi:uncharacterized protein
MASGSNNDAYRLTLAQLVTGLRNTLAIMDKAEAHAAAQTVPLENLLQARLYPDMFNLLQQLQYVCYLAADFAKHFSKENVPRVGYDEATWAELRTSLDTTLRYITAIPPESMAGASGKIVPTFMDESKGMSAVDYAAEVIIPDFHFHMVIAYAILRHNGVPLGKGDYLGKLVTQDLPTA